MNVQITTVNRDSILKITSGIQKTPWGNCLISQVEDALCGFHFWDSKGNVLEVLQSYWPGCDICYDEEQTADWVPFAIKLLQGEDAEGKKLLLMGTPFQVMVWKALIEIEPGKVCSYQDIAIKIKCPRAIRAVGTAIGRNPISLVIPCHRVIREDGDLGGYAWGLERKKALIDYEFKMNIGDYNYVR